MTFRESTFPPSLGARGGPLTAPELGGNPGTFSESCTKVGVKCRHSPPLGGTSLCIPMGILAATFILTYKRAQVIQVNKGFPVPGLMVLVNLSCTLSPFMKRCNLSCSTISYSTSTSESKETGL
jgi:hypothetical protein